MADYGATFGQFRAKAPLWEAYVTHEFVARLGDGTLPRDAFLKYLRQDYVFLVHFSRAWALAVFKAGDLAEMRQAAGVVDALLNHEMALHVETCAREGITQEELERTEEADANLAYTRFVMDAGMRGDFLDLVTALAPCVLGYGEIGARLGREARRDGHPYADWIATYSGAEYQEVCTGFGEMLDRAAAARLGDLASSPRSAALQHLFDTATRLEVAFWQMGLD